MTEIGNATRVVIQAGIVFTVLMLFGLSSCSVGEKVFPGADVVHVSRKFDCSMVNEEFLERGRPRPRL